MSWTNKYDLPKPLADAIMNEPARPRGDNEVSVTELVSPTTKLILTRRHKDEIVRDVSEGVWRLFGSAVHAILERADQKDSLQEERLEVSIGKWTVIGHPDLLDPEGKLTDYKVTKVYAFMRGDKKDWEAQVNCYAYMYREYGFEVGDIEICALLKDWDWRRAERDENYPEIDVITKKIPVWSQFDCLTYLRKRIVALQDAYHRDDMELEPCSAEERWARDEKWAVMKKGRKRAVRLYHREDEAQEHVSQEKGLYVEHRPAEDVRCLRYCEVTQWCPYYQENHADGDGNGSRDSR